MDNSKKIPTKHNNCGSSAGEWSHRKNNEFLCDDCKLFKNKRAKQYRLENKDKVKAATTKWRLTNKEKHKAMKDKWRANNKEKNNIYIKNARAKKPDLYKEMYTNKSRRRRALSKNNDVKKYSLKQILDTHGSICHICGSGIDLKAPRTPQKGANWETGLHIDHVIPISKGGADTLENVRPAHALCNLRKSNRTNV